MEYRKKMDRKGKIIICVGCSCFVLPFFCFFVSLCFFLCFFCFFFLYGKSWGDVSCRALRAMTYKAYSVFLVSHPGGSIYGPPPRYHRISE